MSHTYDPYHLSNPTVYLVKMVIFLIVIGLLGTILATQLFTAFSSNLFLNGFILAVLFIGILLSLRQVWRLFAEVKWVNTLQDGNSVSDLKRPPILLNPVASILRGNIGQAIISPSSMRSILDSVGMRLDEARDTSRYMTGLLVFLGLLGTFFGLLQTVSSVGDVIQSLDAGSADAGSLFTNLKAGLEAPLSGMGTAFASSLFGLSGSLILGFLDLQASQAQNNFYNELEDWMGTMTALDNPLQQAQMAGASAAEIQELIERMGDSMQGSMQGVATSENAILALGELAQGIGELVRHIRGEQENLRSHIADQSAQNKKFRELMDILIEENRKQ